jgi:hypothetical protein
MLKRTTDELLMSECRTPGAGLKAMATQPAADVARLWHDRSALDPQSSHRDGSPDSFHRRLLLANMKVQNLCVSAKTYATIFSFDSSPAITGSNIVTTRSSVT